ncbi:MAG TPA: MGMT family protein [Blastocatellia bacterium]|nr:MGMT family protein [Blastocatellia bacterium]
MARAKIGSSASKAASRGRSRGDRPVPDGYERVFEKIYGLVLKIPRGRVMTYGQIARLLDDRYSPRLVGWAMHVTPKDERNIPWHRVINSQGGISSGRVIIHEPNLQRWMLEAEGVTFDDRGRCDLAKYQWAGPAPKKTPVKKVEESKKTEVRRRKNGNDT